MAKKTFIVTGYVTMYHSGIISFKFDAENESELVGFVNQASNEAFETRIKDAALGKSLDLDFDLTGIEEVK